MTYRCAVSAMLMGCDVTASVSAEGEWCDYGVPGSPEWLEFDGAEIDWPVEVDGREFGSRAELEETWPGMTEAILDWAEEAGEYVDSTDYPDY
jgi:hypothetical protein